MTDNPQMKPQNDNSETNQNNSNLYFEGQNKQDQSMYNSNPNQISEPEVENSKLSNFESKVESKPKVNTENKQTQKEVKPKRQGPGFFTWFFSAILIIILSTMFGGLGGLITYRLVQNQSQEELTFNSNSSSSSTGFLQNLGIKDSEQTIKTVQEESAIIDLAAKNTDAVISIVASREVNNLDRFFGSPDAAQSQDIAAGTGFIVSKDGYVITNKHVVDDNKLTYTAVFNDNKVQEIKVLARDSVLDIAILKLDNQGKEFPAVILGDSDKIRIGQNAVAIGNSLGEFSNTVSKGIVSGLGRNITATDGKGMTDTLENIIQTDASINPGNSGGPLLDIAGNVIGVNVAKAQSAENVGFALPINQIKPILDSVIKTGKIQRPFMGVRYVQINEEIAKKNNLKVDYGALIIGDDKNPAVTQNGPAAKAGLKENDIILEINGQKIDKNNEIRKVIQKYGVGDQLNLKVLQGDQQKDLKIILENFPS